MAGKLFKVPFAVNGDRTATPDALQPNGSMSYAEGFGFDYERPAIDPNTGQPDPLYKPVPREGTNGLYYDITLALGIIQAQGFADWDAAGRPYSIQAAVRHLGQNWISNIANNNDTPGAGSSWSQIPFDGSNYAVDSGTVNAYVGNYSPAIQAMREGRPLLLKASTTNTGASTLNVDQSGPKSILSMSLAPLAPGDIVALGTATFLYHAATDSWVLQSCTGAASSGGGVTLSQAFYMGQI